MRNSLSVLALYRLSALPLRCRMTDENDRTLSSVAVFHDVSGIVPLGRAVRELGVVVPSGRGATATHKPNPAVRIQAWALTAARSLKRELVFLREEQQLALAAQKPVDDDFVGLD